MNAKRRPIGSTFDGSILPGKILSGRIVLDKEIEEWVVNSVKLKMINKLERLLERKGKDNLRQLFLVPVFTVCEMEERVAANAPEIKTLFYKVLSEVISQAEKKILN